MQAKIDSPAAAMSSPSGARALVIGAGLGGLAAAMRLGAKGYEVTVIDRLDMPGGRGSSISQGGHRFDLGPTIVTVPQGLRELWSACGRDFDRDVDLRALDPFYEIRWQDGSSFTARARPVLPDPLRRRQLVRLLRRSGPDARRGGAALAGGFGGL